jgi:hypothetical protein
LKKVTRSTRPAISSEGVRGRGEESFILVEVYSVGVDLRNLSDVFRTTGWPGTTAFSVSNLLGGPKLKLDERFGLLAIVEQKP